MFDLFNVQPEQLKIAWHRIKQSDGWWTFVLAWVVFFFITLIIIPVESRLLLLFVAIPFLTLSFFALVSLLSKIVISQDEGTIPPKIQKLEAELRKSVVRFEVLINALPDRIVMFDAEGMYYDVLKQENDAPIARGVTIGQHISDVFDKDFADFCLRIVKETVAAQKSRVVEYSHTQDGKTYYLQGYVVPLYDTESYEDRVLWITRDITEREQSRQAIIHSEQRLRAFAEALPNRAVILDYDGNYHNVLNDSRLTTALRSDLTGRNLQTVFADYPDFVDYCLSILRKALDDNEVQVIEYLLPNATDGATYYLEGRISPFVDPVSGERMVIWLSQNITERKQSEQAIVNSEKRLRAFANAMPNRAVILDRDGNYHDVLKHFDPSGPPPRDVLGKNIKTVFANLPDFAAYCLSLIHQALDEDKIQVTEYQLTGRDNKLYDMRGHIAPFTDPVTGERMVIWISEDITERKRSEQALINSEQRLRAFANAMPNRAVIMDAEGNYREVLKSSIASKRIEPDDVTGKNLMDMMPSEIAAYCKSIIQKTLAEDRLQIVEYSIPINGESIDFEGHVAPFNDPDTNEKLVIWISQDITERKRSQQVLIDSEQRLRAFADALPNRVVIFDYEGNYRNVLKDYNVEKFGDNTTNDGKNLFDVLEEGFAEFCLQQIRKVIDQNEKVVVEYTLETMKGPAHLEGHIAPFTDPQSGEDLVLWIVHDLTEHKKAQQAAINSESRLRSFIRALPDRVIILDADGRYQEVLQQHYDTQKLEHGDRTGQLLHDIYDKQTADFYVTKIRQTLEDNESKVFVYEASETKKYGKPTILEGRTIPYIDPVTDEPRVLWVSRDITERVRAEQHELDLTLEREKLTLLRNFVESMTHDLKTPLSVIETSLHLLERTDPEAKHTRRVQSIRKQTGIITQMLDDMLAMARLDTVPHISLHPLDLKILLEEIMEVLQPRAEVLAQTVALSIEADETTIGASENELRRALTNLIDNAIKYTPEDGLVSIRVFCEENYLHIEIKDTGIGMTEEEIAMIFNPFFRTETAKSHASGTGLGLAITKRIIELHGGTITAESTYGKGSIFCVRLPLSIHK